MRDDLTTNRSTDNRTDVPADRPIFYLESRFPEARRLLLAANDCGNAAHERIKRLLCGEYEGNPYEGASMVLEEAHRQYVAAEKCLHAARVLIGALAPERGRG